MYKFRFVDDVKAVSAFEGHFRKTMVVFPGLGIMAHTVPGRAMTLLDKPWADL